MCILAAGRVVQHEAVGVARIVAYPWRNEIDIGGGEGERTAAAAHAAGRTIWSEYGVIETLHILSRPTFGY